MYEIKPIRTNPQELCILTEPKQHGAVSMYQKDQPEPKYICSESRLEALESISDRIDTIWSDLNRVAAINETLNDIINDKDDSLFPSLDRIIDIIGEKIQKINNLDGVYKMTQSEVYNSREEYDEPENQSPFGAGTSRADLMGDI